jgi:hypothetical protein
MGRRVSAGGAAGGRGGGGGKQAGFWPSMRDVRLRSNQMYQLGWDSPWPLIYGCALVIRP